MPVLTRILLFCFLGANLGIRAVFGLPDLPASAASMKGTVVWKGCPPVSWSVELPPASQAPWRGRVAVTGQGIDVRGTFAYDIGNTVTWELAAFSLDLSIWFKPLLARVAPEQSADDMVVRGTLAGSAQGKRTPTGLTGGGSIKWSDGVLSSVSRSFELTGLNLYVELNHLEPLSTAPGQRLQFEVARVSGVEITDGVVRFQIEHGKTVHVESAQIRALGGSLVAEPFAFAFSHQGIEAIKARVNASGVALTQVALLLPKVILEAQGKISGGVGLGWDSRTGFALGDGSLRIDRLESVEVRLFPQPGFLTDNVPVTLSLLPAWMGPLSRRMTIANPAHQVLRAIEMGEMPLVVDDLELRTRPEGDAAGRTAHVALSARPKVPGVVEAVDIEVNVSGPLDQVIRIGLENSISSVTSK
jgi:hypothetical protein